MYGREGALVLVNGQYQPVVRAAPEEAQRWRLINACTSRVLSLRLAGHRLVQLAVDGTFLAAPVERDQLVLSPGSRADVVVRPNGTGTFTLIADPVDRGGMGGGMMGGRSGSTEPVVLATLDVGGPARPTAPLPGSLPAEAAAPPASAQRVVTFQMGMGGTGASGMAVAIDGRTFDPGCDDQTVVFGVVEEWTVRNASPLAHPFHLHVWPFTVVATSDGAPTSGVPQDIVLVPPRGWARIRIPFTSYPGRTVYHCHILDHEDSGMMATIRVGS
jgi:FtsP/CotA-like multicopper oxidase with cupredoxin domain